MKKYTSGIRVPMVALLALTLFAAVPVAAESDCIPAGTYVESATLHVYVTLPTGQLVDVHRITAPWEETVVTWNSFGGAYDMTVEGSFLADDYGWRSVDVTSIVQSWVDGVLPNHGLLLAQNMPELTKVVSSESTSLTLRPMLEICYMDETGVNCVVLQRSGDEPDDVADTWISALTPDLNYGTDIKLYTGVVNDYTKQALVRFDFDICDVPAGCRFTGGGVDTDGNWDHRLENGQMVRNGAGGLPDDIDRATFGGQVGANTALPPQPAGEWTHHQQRGPSGRFTFHGGTASAPLGTEIDDIRCSDPDGCSPSGDPPSPVKQLDFDGIGTFKNVGMGHNAPVFEIAGANVTAEGHGRQDFAGTFHWFEVNIDDLGEPGGYNSGAPGSETCPDAGFGEKGATEYADCDCPDFYRITIYNGVDAADVLWNDDGSIDPSSLLRDPEDVIYEFYGYIDGGNLQIHHPTGYDQ